MPDDDVSPPISAVLLLPCASATVNRWSVGSDATSNDASSIDEEEGAAAPPAAVVDCEGGATAAAAGGEGWAVATGDVRCPVADFFVGTFATAGAAVVIAGGPGAFACAFVAAVGLPGAAVAVKLLWSCSDGAVVVVVVVVVAAACCTARSICSRWSRRSPGTAGVVVPETSAVEGEPADGASAPKIINNSPPSAVGNLFARSFSISEFNVRGAGGKDALAAGGGEVAGDGVSLGCAAGGVSAFFTVAGATPSAPPPPPLSTTCSGGGGGGVTPPSAVGVVTVFESPIGIAFLAGGVPAAAGGAAMAFLGGMGLRELFQQLGLSDMDIEVRELVTFPFSLSLTLWENRGMKRYQDNNNKKKRVTRWSLGGTHAGHTPFLLCVVFSQKN